MAALSVARIVGRYAVFSEIAAGGMASVHLGRLIGASGFSRVVALKRLHTQFANDSGFVASFLDEARLAGRIRHPNVVSILDVVSAENELLLVMDYVQGETLARLIRAARTRNETIPLPIVGAIFSGVLRGLHAAHEATNEAGEPLNIVHRDISPQNILVGADGVARLLDFGIAKAAGRSQNTSQPTLKGKIAYMPPEQAQAGEVTRRTDIYAIGIVLWEALTLHRLFEAEDQVALLNKVLTVRAPDPSTVVAGVSPELDAIVLKALQHDPEARFSSAGEMASALEACISVAPPSAVSAWLEKLAGSTLAQRAQTVSEVERTPLAEGHKPLVERQDEKPSDLAPATQTLSMPKPSSSRWPVVAMIAVFVLVGIAMLSRRNEPSVEPRAIAALPPAPTPTPAPAEPSASATITAAPTIAASAPPSASVAKAPIAPKAPTPTAKAAKAKCNPPYVVDSNGKHRYLPECL